MPVGYSGTPLAKKLGYQPGLRVFLDNAPANYLDLLAPLPDDVTFLSGPDKDLDLVHIFTDSAKTLAGKLKRYLKQIKSNDVIWVS